MIRIAFTLIGGKNWTGGYNYLLNLLRVLDQVAPGALQPVLFAGTDVPAAELAPFAAITGCTIEQNAAFNEDARLRTMVRSLLLGRDAEVLSALQRQQVDVVFESAVFLGWRLPIPAIAWIPDLQHRFLPHLFSRMALVRREIGFKAQIASGRTIMCSSEDTRRACEELYPGCKGRVHAVRFAVRSPSALSDEEALAVAKQHGLPERFFFMPNQFWVHKNHRLVLEALKLLSQQGQQVTVVASGQQHDPRDPSHASALLADIRAAGLQDRFLTPGLLPYADLAPLMQASTALLNPSLFEGWSTTVEEAKAAGIPMLLSDLPVHREQAEGMATFFDPRSARSLAQALVSFNPPNITDRQTQRRNAASEARGRVSRFASDFVKLVHHASDTGRAS
jgi:glycosyltransferase involved in cell wall biosynthesis